MKSLVHRALPSIPGTLVSSLFLAFVVVGSMDAMAQTGSRDPQRPDPPGGTASPQGSPQLKARASGEVQVGERAPDFELDASGGKPLRLSSFRGRWTVLVFGDRKETVAPLRSVAAQLDSAGIQLIGVCAEKAYFLESFARRQKFPFPLLADVTREVSDMYGLYDSRERTVLPGFFLISATGDVQLALLGQTLPPNDVARLARYVAARP